MEMLSTINTVYRFYILPKDRFEKYEMIRLYRCAKFNSETFEYAQLFLNNHAIRN